VADSFVEWLSVCFVAYGAAEASSGQHGWAPSLVLWKLRKHFFLKKEAKTFATAPAARPTWHHPEAAPKPQSFLVLFFKKERLV
jgi:hypothetical protein